MYCCAVLVSQVIGHVLVHEARRVKRLRLEANGLVITPHVSMPNKTYSVREVRALHSPRPFLFYCWYGPSAADPHASLSLGVVLVHQCNDSA